MTVIALLYIPVVRISGDAEVNYNEGWNAYRQAAVNSGSQVYGLRPDPFRGATTYPPVSFHVVALLARGRDFVTAGRWVSLISLVLCGVFVGLIVRRTGADWRISSFCCLLYVIGIAVLFPNRLGMNDPQLFGEALCAAGLFFYLRDSASPRMLCLSALAFCLAGFTKQNLLAFPAAVGVDLLFRARRPLVTWFSAMLLIGGALALLVLALDGRNFFGHLVFPRTYSYKTGWSANTHTYLLMFQALLLVAVIGCLSAFRSRPVLAVAFAISHILAFFLAGGNGVDVNIYFNALAAAVILTGTALVDARGAGNPAGSPYRGFNKATPLILGLLASMAIHLPGRLHDFYDEWKLWPARNAEFRRAVQLLEARPGPALCESLLLCYEAGKPHDFDSFVIRDQIKLHRLEENKVLDLLRTRQLQTVQLTVSQSEADGNPELLVQDRLHFTHDFMQELVNNYRVVLRTSQLLIFVPR